LLLLLLDGLLRMYVLLQDVLLLLLLHLMRTANWQPSTASPCRHLLLLQLPLPRHDT
jgi:hypothetical protein